MKKRSSCQKGAVIVESAMVMFLWLILFIMFVDACLLLTSYFSINQAVKQVGDELTLIPIPLETGEFKLKFVVIPGSAPSLNCDMKRVTSDSEAVKNTNCRITSIFYSAINGRAIFMTDYITGFVHVRGRSMKIELAGLYAGLFSFGGMFPITITGNNDIEYLWPPFETAKPWDHKSGDFS